MERHGSFHQGALEGLWEGYWCALLTSTWEISLDGKTQHQCLVTLFLGGGIDVQAWFLLFHCETSSELCYCFILHFSWDPRQTPGCCQAPWAGTIPLRHVPAAAAGSRTPRELPRPKQQCSMAGSWAAFWDRHCSDLGASCLSNVLSLPERGGRTGTRPNLYISCARESEQIRGCSSIPNVTGLCK